MRRFFSIERWVQLDIADHFLVYLRGMKITLRKFNNVLSVLVVLLCLYVIVAPFLPELAYRTQKAPLLVASEEGDAPEVIPEENTLVIPRMKLQEKIHEGGQWLLSKGIWHTPQTGSPAAGGNMVLSGHRFTYGGPAVLYHLDKVQEGDKIVIYWEQKRYEYTVHNIFVVPPTQVEIQNQTEEPLLTIYTCTPLVTAKDRLVIQAIPTGED